MRKITPWLWFDTEGEEAATFYVSRVPELEDSRHRALRRGGASSRRGR